MSRAIPSEFCLGSDFCCCKNCGDKAPDYTPMCAATVSDLSMIIDRDDMADFLPPKKQPKVAEKENQHTSEGSVKLRGKASLSLKKVKGKKEAKDRFGDTSCEELTNLSKGYVPQNTEKNTQWAMRVFEQWQEARCVRGNPVPDKLLQAPYYIGALSHWLSLFVSEVRKADGSLYPPKSNYQLLCGILRYMKQQDPFAPNFLERKDGRFRELHATCESVFRQLREKGVGANPNKTASISKEEENMLWDKRILGTSNLLMLQRAVFFSVGKVFCLRGGEEQRKLKPSQLIRKSNPDRYVYVETGSKNRTGDLKQLNVENKVVPVYASPADGERCLVYLLDFYLKKLPPIAFEKDILYWQPKNQVPDDPAASWYNCQPVGKHKLNGMVAAMFEEAGGQERKTNHSLRVAGATALYTGDVPEREIQQRTGHRSLEALRKYERTSEQQQQAISHMLVSPAEQSYHDSLVPAQSRPLSKVHQSSVNPLPTIRNSLKKQKSLYKVLTPSIKTPI